MRPIIPRTELTPITSLPSLYNPRDLALIRRTVAMDTTDDEFALFIHWARSLRLDQSDWHYQSKETPSGLGTSSLPP
jgi:hypothetical protein